MSKEAPNFETSYIGTVGMAHSIKTIIEAPKLYKNHKDKRIIFQIIGDGADKKHRT